MQARDEYLRESGSIQWQWVDGEMVRSDGRTTERRPCPRIDYELSAEAGKLPELWESRRRLPRVKIRRDGRLLERSAVPEDVYEKIQEGIDLGACGGDVPAGADLYSWEIKEADE